MENRTRVIPVSDVAEALAYCDANGLRPVIDLDGTLVPTGTDVRVADRPPSDVVRLARGTGAAILTNRRHAPQVLWGVPVIPHAGKPWTPISRLIAPPGAVIGDQFLTDGILATRLHVPFLRVTPPPGPARPWRSRLADRALAPFFRTDDGR